MIHELRIYTTLPGRMPALLGRFENVTLKLWARYGIRQLGFWTTIIGPRHLDLTYMLAWESMAARESKWSAFQADPDWQQALKDSEKDGPILANVASSLLKPTSFSASIK